MAFIAVIGPVNGIARLFQRGHELPVEILVVLHHKQAQSNLLSSAISKIRAPVHEGAILSLDEDPQHFPVPAQQRYLINIVFIPAAESAAQRLGMSDSRRRPKRARGIREPVIRDRLARIAGIEASAVQMRSLGAKRRANNKQGDKRRNKKLKGHLEDCRSPKMNGA
jgi:hypothetical protein